MMIRWHGYNIYLSFLLSCEFTELSFCIKPCLAASKNIYSATNCSLSVRFIQHHLSTDQNDSLQRIGYGFSVYAFISYCFTNDKRYQSLRFICRRFFFFSCFLIHDCLFVRQVYTWFPLSFIFSQRYSLGTTNLSFVFSFFLEFFSRSRAIF